MFYIRISLLLMLIMGILTGCNNNLEKFDIDYMIGVIETTGQENQSVITYYDRELQKVYTQNFPFGTMGSIFYNPIIYKNNLYIIPQGLANTKDLKMVLEIDLTNGNTKEYTINQLAMNSLAVNEDYIYTCNTFNGNSYISRCKKENNSITDMEIAEIYISKLALAGDKLLAFCAKRNEMSLNSYIYVFDLDLNLLQTIDISKSGSSHYKTALIGEEIYFSNPMDEYDRPNTQISSLSTNNLEIKNIDLENVYPSDIIPYQKFLIIAHCDLVSHEGNLITFYNTEEETLHTITLKHTILQMKRQSDNLFIMDQEKLYWYQIKGTSLLLNKEIPIKTIKNTNVFYYVSGFFLKEEATEQ